MIYSPTYLKLFHNLNILTVRRQFMDFNGKWKIRVRWVEPREKKGLLNFLYYFYQFSRTSAVIENMTFKVGKIHLTSFLIIYNFQLGLFVSTPFLMRTFASMLYGALADKLIERKIVSTTNVRKISTLICKNTFYFIKVPFNTAVGHQLRGDK